MNRRESLIALGTGGLIAASNWPALGQYLPTCGAAISSLQFSSMAEIGRFVDQVLGISCKIRGIYVVPNLITEDGGLITWEIDQSIAPGFCRVEFMDNTERTVRLP